MAARTTTVAEPTTVPRPAVAVTVPLPSTRPALKVTAPPRPRTNVASAVGATLHVRFAGVAFPKLSTASPVNVNSPRARTSRESGVTEMRVAAPATTVTSREACVVPGASAVTVATPARVSR